MQPAAVPLLAQGMYDKADQLQPLVEELRKECRMHVSDPDIIG